MKRSVWHYMSLLWFVVFAARTGEKQPSYYNGLMAQGTQYQTPDKAVQAETQMMTSTRLGDHHVMKTTRAYDLLLRYD